MKRFAITLTIGLLLLASTAMTAEVTNVELSRQEGYTVIRIDVDGAVRYSHQTEEPKNGKPDRLIVDVLAAVHALGQKNFLELPDCGVQSIRSSQYAVTPEQIVRIVLDLDAAPVYRVDSNDKSITIYLNDNSGSPFAAWSTSAWLSGGGDHFAATQKPAAKPATAAPAKPLATASQKNEAIEKDRMASLSGTAEPKAASANKTEAAEVKSDTKAESKSEPLPWYAAAPEESKPVEPKTVEKPVESPEPTAVNPPAPKIVAKKETASEPPANPPKMSAKQDKPVEKPQSNDQQTLAKKVMNTTPAESTPTPVAVQSKPVSSTKPVAAAEPKASSKSTNSSTPAKSPAEAELAQNDEADDTEEQTARPTSRFRRNAATAKIKGTMVAEFPKRLVIKYKASGYRDPFRTLIDDTRTYDNPIEARVPNIEGLKLVGVIESNDNANRALFEDNDGYSYMLKSGDKVRNGYVLRVETDKVYFQIFEYGWSRTVALEMEY